MRIRTCRRPSSVRRWGTIAAALALCAGTALAEVAAPPGTVDDGAQAAGLATWERAADAALRARAEALAAGGDADDKFAAFLLYPVESTFDARAAGRPARLWPAHVQQWLLDASGDPDSPSLPALWRVAGDCPLAPARCDADGALERLLRLDPGNGAVWLLRAQRADARGDDAGRQRWFARAAEAPRIDFYDRDQGRLLLDAGAGVELPPMDSPAAMALQYVAGADFPATPAGWLDAALLGRWLAWVVPGLQWAIGECRPGDAAVQDAVQLDRCRRLFARMADQASMVVTQLAALSISIQLQPGLASLREDYRQALWQAAQIGARINRPGATPMPDYAHLVLDQGELAAWRRLLQQEGIDPAPPHGWLPDQARQRELILAGATSR
jgi:hypothetical protein